MRIPKGVHQGGERPTRLRQSVVAFRMEQNLVFRHDATEERQHVPDAELLEEKADRRVGYGQRGTEGWLKCLSVARPDTKTNLWAAWRRHLNAAQNVAHECFQRHRHVLDVHGIDYAQAVLGETTIVC